MPAITLWLLSSYPPFFALLCDTGVSHVPFPHCLLASYQALPEEGAEGTLEDKDASLLSSGFSCFSSGFWGFWTHPMVLIPMQVSGPPQRVVPAVTASTTASSWHISQAPSWRIANKSHLMGNFPVRFPCRSFSANSACTPEGSS